MGREGRRFRVLASGGFGDVCRPYCGEANPNVGGELVLLKLLSDGPLEVTDRFMSESREWTELVDGRFFLEAR
jgi:hypothetical protein